MKSVNNLWRFTMKEYFKKLFKLLWNKTVLSFLLGAILAAAGIALKPETLDTLVCLLGQVEGC